MNSFSYEDDDKYRASFSDKTEINHMFQTTIEGNEPYPFIDFSKCSPTMAKLRCKNIEINSDKLAELLDKGMRGDNAKQRYKDIRNYTSKYGVGTKEDMQFTSVSADQRSSSLNDYEIAIKRNENILPEYFVDVSCRELFDNVAVDANGNYYEYNPDYKAVADAQKDYYDRKKAGQLKPGEKKPADWDGAGYTPKWDKNGRLIGMNSLTD